MEELTKEQLEQAEAYEEDNWERTVYCKCKPTYNFQSIEFEWYLTDSNKEEMKDLYLELLSFLMDNAPEQATAKEEPKKKVNPATEKQKAIMDRFGILYPKDCSVEFAQKLIKESIDKSK